MIGVRIAKNVLGVAPSGQARTVGAMIARNVRTVGRQEQIFTTGQGTVSAALIVE